MKYNLDWLIGLEDSGTRVKYIFFWGHQPSKDGTITASCFSQWWAYHPFTIDNIEYITAEHWMMAAKARLFEDTEILQQILEAKTPGEAKKLGRQVRNFDQGMWEEKRFEIVVEGNLQKFTQHEALKTFLIGTGERVIVEASPVDRIWGIGMAKDDENATRPAKWKGLNLLGFALMVVRDKIIE